MSVGQAVQMAFERDFTILPISEPGTRRLLGWIHATSLRSSLEANAVSPDTLLSEMELSAKGVSGGQGGVVRFDRGRGYTG